MFSDFPEFRILFMLCTGSLRFCGTFPPGRRQLSGQRRHFSPGLHMTKWLVMLCSTIFSALGWYAGESFGIFTAFIVSMVGTGVGMYVGRQLANRLDS